MSLLGLDIINYLYKAFLALYRKVYLPLRAKSIQKKRIIDVTFVLSDLGKWKTESLFQVMMNHDRFDPIIVIAPYDHYNNSDIKTLEDYIRFKGYKYYLLNENQAISEVKKSDIIFYQEPYKGVIDSNKEFKYNFRSLFCYVAYGFHWNNINWILNQPLLNFCWQIYYENNIAMRGVSAQMTNSGKNCIVTGLPITDIFIRPKASFHNPWKPQTKRKIRIIWAPHYTISDGSAFRYSTFLEYCDYMLIISEKYQDYIQIAFKPHPILLTKLYEIWGEKKTDNYYSKWENGANTQLELGEYAGLFMHSDAMIHDCGTFTVEYHYTHNPVLYLLNGTNHEKDMNEFGRMAFDLHYKGRSEEDIESFINDVIDGRDEMKEVREKFYNDYLLPPNGLSASDNIIKAILGE